MKLRLRWATCVPALLAAVCYGQQAQSLTIDLANAIDRARAFSPQFQAATLASLSAREDSVQARAALKPTVDILNGYMFTQGNGTDTGTFVTSNGVHLFDEQARVNAEVFSVTKRAQLRQAQAAEAAARARIDVARRGLVATVIANYYSVVAAKRRIANAKKSLDEADAFLTLTNKQEAGGEVAHSDVLRAQIQRSQRQRESIEASATLAKTKVDLAVLLFQDLAQAFDVVDDLNPKADVGNGDEVARLAVTNNPDIAAAEATAQQARYGVRAAQGLRYPTVDLNYAFGIDANQFAYRNPDGQRYLGSVVAATVTVPVWNFGSTKSRIKQSQLVQQQAENDLNFARRQIQANINQFQIEAGIARTQLLSLADTGSLAEKNLSLTLLRYQAGEASALEVVDAQSIVADARNAYDDGLTRYRLALANIETLTGRY